MGSSVRSDFQATVLNSETRRDDLDPRKAMVPVSTGRLDLLHRDFEDPFHVTILVSPTPTNMIFGKKRSDLGTWFEDAAAMTEITPDHGFHYNGHLLKGMQFPNLASSNDEKSYDTEWAENVHTVLDFALPKQQAVITDLALGTGEMIFGYDNGHPHQALFEDYLFADIDAVNEKIRQQGSGTTIFSRGYSGATPHKNAHTQFTGSLETGFKPEGEMIVFDARGSAENPIFTVPRGEPQDSDEDLYRFESRPMALVISPSFYT